MYPATNCPRNVGSKEKRGWSVRTESIPYTPPQIKDNKSGYYIEYHAYNPATGKMGRKIVKLNHIKTGVAERRKFAREMCRRLSDQLSHGWNPWIHGAAENLELFGDCMDRFLDYITKMIEDGYFRKETYAGYRSQLKILGEYVEKRNPIHYAYQFDKKFCNDFLDYVFIDRNNGAQTRNNYLAFLRVFSGFLVEKGILEKRPTDGIRNISKRLYRKTRETIPADVVGRISAYTKENDPHFHLACLLLYYCFIRPVEMTRMKVGDIKVGESLILLPETATKNKRTQPVTIPKKVLDFCRELGVLKAPVGDYVFSRWLKPGPEQIDPKIFRDHWAKVRKALKLNKRYQFYSLKDTGISEMCDSRITPIDVRDQARHESLETTNIYLRQNRRANSDIREFDGSF